MKPEPMEEFELELREALRPRTAPLSLKRGVMEKRCARRLRPIANWQRLAASVALAAALGGVAQWRHAEEVRKGEAARQQVLTALRIAGYALDKMNLQLAAQGRAQE